MIIKGDALAGNAHVRSSFLGEQHANRDEQASHAREAIGLCLRAINDNDRTESSSWRMSWGTAR
jgi:hypothetical protein